MSPTKATKAPKEMSAKTMASPPRARAPAGPTSPSRARITSANAKVERNPARVPWAMRSARNVRSTRGESCWAARVSATSVTENARPATETVAVAMVWSTARAEAASESPKSPSSTFVLRSICVVRKARTIGGNAYRGR